MESPPAGTTHRDAFMENLTGATTFILVEPTLHMLRILREFREFLRKFKVVGGAVAFIIALAVTKLVNSLVNDVLSPLLGLALPQERLSLITWNVGGATVKIGSFLSVLMEFVIIVGIIFLFVRYALKWVTRT